MPELNIASCDWNAYITLLRQQDALWARHRDNISLSSYLRCLEDARAVLSLPSWDELSHREATILLGLGTQYGPHGLLGSLRGAGIVKTTFMQDIPEYRHMRIRIRDAILAAREAETIMDFIRCAQTAVDTIVRLPRFSMATATRLLTLARPDRAVSINGASKAGLARLTGASPGTTGCCCAGSTRSAGISRLCLRMRARPACGRPVRPCSMFLPTTTAAR